MDFIPKVKLNYEPDEEKSNETKEDKPDFVYEDDDEVKEKKEESR